MGEFFFAAKQGKSFGFGTVALMKRFPHLQNFFGAYLNQDFDYFGDTLDEVVCSYKNSKRSRDVVETRQEIAAFLAEYGEPEQDLTKAVCDLFSPEVIVEGWNGMTTREFFVQVDAWPARPIPGWETFPNLRKLFKRGLNQQHATNKETQKDLVLKYKKITGRYELDLTQKEIASFLAEYGNPGQNLDYVFRNMFSPDVPPEALQGMTAHGFLNNSTRGWREQPKCSKSLSRLTLRRCDGRRKRVK